MIKTNDKDQVRQDLERNPKKKKKDRTKKQLSWWTRCWECRIKIQLRDDDDPDKKIAQHRASPECKARNR